MNLAKLNLHVSELMNDTPTDDCVGNLTIGYLLVWIHTIEQNSKKAREMARFQEKMLDQFGATTAQVREAFNRASDTFTRFTGIRLEDSLDLPQDEQTTIAQSRISLLNKVYLN